MRYPLSIKMRDFAKFGHSKPLKLAVIPKEAVSSWGGDSVSFPETGLGPSICSWGPYRGDTSQLSSGLPVEVGWASKTPDA